MGSQNAATFSLYVGLIIGLFIGWAVSLPLRHQRDYWREAYCRATQFELDFCAEFRPTPPENT